MTKLSVNINKIATIRNARGGSRKLLGKGQLREQDVGHQDDPERSQNSRSQGLCPTHVLQPARKIGSAWG